jgi:AraC-like DNA-binding protein
MIKQKHLTKSKQYYIIIKGDKMNENWSNVIISKISVAVYVAPVASDEGKHLHKNRPYHGFVLNDDDGLRDYVFDDGREMRTAGGDLFYLPKGSTYYVKNVRNGGCYAINFDADIFDEPFCLSLRNTNQLLHHFKAATDAWKRKDALRIPIAMGAVYDAVCQAHREIHKQYIPKTHLSLIAPALDVMNQQFTDNHLNVSYLASLCGVSEVYFRKLFFNCFGVSPKEYMIQRRIEYAKTMLISGDFSVSTVATLCGYAEPCHFSREFTKRVGISPSQYFRQ